MVIVPLGILAAIDCWDTPLALDRWLRPVVIWLENLLALVVLHGVALDQVHALQLLFVHRLPVWH